MSLDTISSGRAFERLADEATEPYELVVFDEYLGVAVPVATLKQHNRIGPGFALVIAPYNHKGTYRQEHIKFIVIYKRGRIFVWHRPAGFPAFAAIKTA